MPPRKTKAAPPVEKPLKKEKKPVPQMRKSPRPRDERIAAGFFCSETYVCVKHLRHRWSDLIGGVKKIGSLSIWTEPGEIVTASQMAAVKQMAGRHGLACAIEEKETVRYFTFTMMTLEEAARFDNERAAAPEFHVEPPGPDEKSPGEKRLEAALEAAWDIIDGTLAAYDDPCDRLETAGRLQKIVDEIRGRLQRYRSETMKTIWEEARRGGEENDAAAGA